MDTTTDFYREHRARMRKLDRQVEAAALTFFTLMSLALIALAICLVVIDGMIVVPLMLVAVAAIGVIGIVFTIRTRTTREDTDATRR